MWLIVAAVVAVVGLIAARVLAGFYVDYLWFESVDRTDVFWGQLTAKLMLFAMFAGTFIVLVVLNLMIADRLAPSSFAANVHPLVERFHQFFGRRLRLFRFAVAIAIGLLAALPTMGRWQDWLMFRNSKSFGVNDPHFGNDVGFYLFKLPFVTFVIDWLFIAMTLITVLVVLDHVLSGGIVVQPPRPKVRRATKAHVAVLLAVLAVLKACDYWVTRYELTTASRGAVRGITYAVDNAQLPAVLLLALIALATAGLYVSTLKTDRWRPAVVASGLWAVIALVAGIIYPAAVQSLVVNPNQKDKEAKYIAYNIEATRRALGIDQVVVEEVSFADLSRAEIADNVAALTDARLLRPVETIRTRFQTDEPLPGTKVTDVDPDRYLIDGVERQVIVGARELDLSQVGNKSWQGTHLINTHGCGLVMSPAGQIDTSRKPAYDDTIAAIERPQIYFGTSMSGYAVLNTTVSETACEGEEVQQYSGDGGVELDSTLRRLALALEEFDYNLLGSSAITSESRFVSVRNVGDRVSKVAPFLALDADPYPVVVDGRIVWVIDAYTTSNRYPYGENADLSQLSDNSGLDSSFNYVRNSVKAVVDAYDGSITLYVNDPTDPVVQVWSSAFPDLFTPLDAMPAELRSHMRYPEDLFRIQTAAYSKYRLDSTDFFDRSGAWSVALGAPELDPAPTAASSGDDGSSSESVTDAGSTQFASDSSERRFEPYYTMFHASGDAEATFRILRPFQPFSTNDQNKSLVAYMTASGDPDSYGQLVVYLLPTGTEEDGPYNVGAAMNSDPEVSQYATLNNNADGGTRVQLGDLQMLPVADGLLWFRPLYVEQTASGQPLVNKMIVSYKGRVAMGNSIGEALAELFPGLSVDVGDVVSGSGSDPDDPDPDDPDPDEPDPDATAAELLAEADDLFDEADDALRDADLETYAAKITAARELVRRAIELLESAG